MAVIAQAGTTRQVISTQFSIYPVYITFVSSKSIHSAIKCYLIKVRLKCNESRSNTLQWVIFSTFFRKNLNFIKKEIPVRHNINTSRKFL